MPSGSKLFVACVVCLFVLATEAFSLQSLPTTSSKVSLTKRSPAFVPASTSSIAVSKSKPAIVTKPHGDEFAMRMVSASGISGGSDKPSSPISKALSAIWNDQTKLLVYVGVWYLGNIYYNIYNKKALI